MELKEYLMENELIKALPDTFPKQLACRDSIEMLCFVTLWNLYVRKLTSYGEKAPYTPRKMYEYYIKKREEEASKLKITMRYWWLHENESGKSNGKILNEEIKKFFKQQKGNIPEFEGFETERFEALFENTQIPEPVPDFYSFFNPQTKVVIKHSALPRTKNIPLTGSRHAIQHKFSKNLSRIEDYLGKLYKNYYNINRFDGKTWNEYISDFVAEKISEAVMNV